MQGHAMTREQLDEITRRYLQQTFEDIEERLALDWRNTGAARDERQWQLQEKGQQLTALLSQADPAEFLQVAETLLPEADDTTLRKLARRLIEVELEGIDAELAAWEGQPLKRPETIRPTKSIETPKETPRVSEVAEMYAAERIARQKWTAKTELQSRTIFATIAELLGDPQIGAVTKADIRELGQTITRLPSNLTQRFPGVSLREALQRAEASAAPRLQARSINKYYQQVRSLFAWAAEQDVIATNPATILSDVNESRAKEDRLPFTDSDLRAFFARLDSEPGRPELYWVPRIMAFSGMRLNEVAQLTRTDLRQERGVWVFDVNEQAEGKRLKTQSSRRLVPIHSRLIELGMLDALGDSEHLIAKKWRHTANPARGAIDALSKLLNRKLRDAGITDKRKTGAHSFRHTVAARLANASVPEYQIADLLGHEHEQITSRRYGATTDVVRLKAVVDLLSLPI
jgi:integrase